MAHFLGAKKCDVGARDHLCVVIGIFLLASECFLCLKNARDFHQLGPLGRVGLRVAMSVCVSVCLSVCMCHRVQFFSRPLIGPQIT